MHTLGDIVKALNRSAVYLHGLQSRFELPALDGAAYSDAYLAFLRTVVYLRMLNVSEDALRDLWQAEKKLLQLLHVDSTDSPVWFLNDCGKKTHPHRRLLLSNYDIGTDVRSLNLQPRLNFAGTDTELFGGREMGEDALRVLGEYLELHRKIQRDVALEQPVLQKALHWSKGIKEQPPAR